MYARSRRLPAAATALALAGLVAAGCGGAPVIGTARAVPDPTSVAAPPSATTSPGLALDGTTWAGTDSDGDAYVYRFNPGGRFSYTSPNGTFGGADDTWSQSGDQVTMSTNSGYSTYHGTIQGDTVSGTASNEPGHTWTWTATRQ